MHTAILTIFLKIMNKVCERVEYVIDKFELMIGANIQWKLAAFSISPYQGKYKFTMQGHH